MTVIYLRRFARPRGHSSAVWRVEEMGELFRLFAALRDRGVAAGVEFGKTDLSDPQFYVLGSEPECACILFVSRITRSNRPWFVAQNGAGEVISEGQVLCTVVDAAIVARSDRRTIPYLTCTLLLLCWKVATARALTDLLVEAGNAPLSILELAA